MMLDFVLESQALPVACRLAGAERKRRCSATIRRGDRLLRISGEPSLTDPPSATAARRSVLAKSCTSTKPFVELCLHQPQFRREVVPIPG